MPNSKSRLPFRPWSATEQSLSYLKMNPLIDHKFREIFKRHRIAILVCSFFWISSYVEKKDHVPKGIPYTLAMTSSSLPDAFKQSYINSAHYPLNMANTTPNASPKFLEGLNERLNEMSDQLFVDAESEVEIPWRDLGVGSGRGKHSNYHSVNKSYLLTYQILKRRMFTIPRNWQR